MQASQFTNLIIVLYFIGISDSEDSSYWSHTIVATRFSIPIKIATLSITPISITAFDTGWVSLSWMPFMLSIQNKPFADSHYAECRYVECCDADCHCAKKMWPECIIKWKLLCQWHRQTTLLASCSISYFVGNTKHNTETV